jgi:hypothetical protein
MAVTGQRRQLLIWARRMGVVRQDGWVHGASLKSDIVPFLASGLARV